MKVRVPTVKFAQSDAIFGGAIVFESMCQAEIVSDWRNRKTRVSGRTPMGVYKESSGRVGQRREVMTVCCYPGFVCL
jgi:hypothetical protein